MDGNTGVRSNEAPVADRLAKRMTFRVPRITLDALLAKYDRDDFKRGVHWLYEDGDSNVLFVVCNTASRQTGKFNGYRSTQGFPFSRLFLADPTNQYYNRMVDDVVDMLGDLREAKDFQRIVYWGSSMGAYASLLLSVIGPRIPSQSYSFAPQFDLMRKNTPASQWIEDPAALDRRFTDLVPLLEKNHCDRYGILPCHHWADGAQLIDIEAAASDTHHLQFGACSHRVLEDMIAVLGKGIYEDYLDRAGRGLDIVVPEAFVPSALDLELGIASYEGMEYLEGRAACPDLARDDTGTRNHGWLSAKLRILQHQKKFVEAIEPGVRAIELQPDNREYQACLANMLASSGLGVGLMLAEGVYRHIGRRDRAFSFLLERHLTARGLRSELPPA